MLSAIKEDGVEAKKKTRTLPPLLLGKTKVKCGVTLSLGRHPPHPACFFFDIYNELSMHFGSEGIRETKTN